MAEIAAKIAIVTDGSLPPNPSVPVDAVVPFNVPHQVLRGGVWRDEVKKQTELTRKEFFDIQRTTPRLPTTSQPSPGEFLTTFLDLVGLGYQEIIVLTVPLSKSGTFNSAMEAVERLHVEHPEIGVSVVDTGTTASGVEYMAEVAAKARDAGASRSAIVAELEQLRPRIELFAALDNIRFVGSSGRIEVVDAQNVGGMLDAHARWWSAKKAYLRRFAVKTASRLAAKSDVTFHWTPKLVVSIHEGRDHLVGFNKHFPSAVDRLVKEIKERVASGKKIKRLYILHSQAEEEVARVFSDLRSLCENVVLSEEIPIALLAITGPVAVGVICVYE